HRFPFLSGTPRGIILSMAAPRVSKFFPSLPLLPPPLSWSFFNRTSWISQQRASTRESPHRADGPFRLSGSKGARSTSGYTLRKRALA
ncbi:hypothetical protein KI387_027245, partial [Taxus chinensis]